ncbi:hypothetical protein [Arthrobacter methylotrophus]|uniref:Uncharacterized protein n=1 Tax=Arthrobacter methylotrophus TaxID=121291 RepID=A0ABV5UP94_9MICC
MSPGKHHSYHLTERQSIIELTWPRPPKQPKATRKGRKLRLLHCRPDPGSPESCVNPEDFSAAVKILDQQDVELAISAFTGLGYEVTIRTLR